MEFAVSGAKWVVGKALGSVKDGVLEAWTASKGLGSNVEALKKELLYVQAVLDIAQGREMRSAALEELLHKLQQQAYNADDVLDELDYFRIHDEIYGTFEAADEDARGCIRDAIMHAHHIFCATVGKHFPCCSFVQADDATSGGTMDTSIAPDMLVRFDRVGMSKRVQAIVDELRPLCAQVQGILNLEPPLDCNRSMTNDIKTRPIVNPDILVYNFLGREVETEQIMNLIAKGDSCDKDLTVLPIVGQGGMGKSTLAKHIYDTVEEKDFQVKIWISVCEPKVEMFPWGSGPSDE